MGANSSDSSPPTIAVENQHSSLYDFHKDHISSKEQLTFPSYLCRQGGKHLLYAERSLYQKRDFQINFKSQEQQDVIVVRRVFSQQKIWKPLPDYERIQLYSGQVIRLGGLQLLVKKVCPTILDLCQADNTENLTKSSIEDNNDNLNSYMFLSNFLKSKEMLKDCSLKTLQDCDGDKCRVCYHSENQNDPLLNLCKCSGSVKYIHYSCLKSWIRKKSNSESNELYQYNEYDSHCDLCKQKMKNIVTHNQKKYAVFGNNSIHPPYVVLSILKQTSSKNNHMVKEYVINFHNQKQIQLGKNNADVSLRQSTVSKSHCQIQLQNKRFFLKNLSPKHGTFSEAENIENISGSNGLKLLIGSNLINFNDSIGFKIPLCCGSKPLKLQLQGNQYEQ